MPCHGESSFISTSSEKDIRASSLIVQYCRPRAPDVHIDDVRIDGVILDEGALKGGRRVLIVVASSEQIEQHDFGVVEQLEEERRADHRAVEDHMKGVPGGVHAQEVRVSREHEKANDDDRRGEQSRAEVQEHGKQTDA